MARRMGKMFFSLGLLPSDEVVEISASDLVTGFANQAGKLTRDVMKKAGGKVLFIDEAYQLHPQQGGSMMQEVVDEIVKCLLHEDFKGKMIVILAGYERHMNAMLSVNQGLRSRFTKRLLFEDFSAKLVIELLTLRLAKDLEVSATVIEELPRLADEIIKMPFFANARDIETIAEKSFRLCGVRCKVAGDDDPVIEVCDIRLAIQDLLSTKGVTSTTAAVMPLPAPQQHQVAFSQSIPPLQPVTVATATATVVLQETEQEEKEEELANASNELPAPAVTEFTIKLQDLLDEMGLNNQAGVKELSLLSVDNDRLKQIALAIAKKLDSPIEENIAMLIGMIFM